MSEQAEQEILDAAANRNLDEALWQARAEQAQAEVRQLREQLAALVANWRGQETHHQQCARSSERPDYFDRSIARRDTFKTCADQLAAALAPLPTPQEKT